MVGGPEPECCALIIPPLMNSTGGEFRVKSPHGRPHGAAVRAWLGSGGAADLAPTLAGTAQPRGIAAAGGVLFSDGRGRRRQLRNRAGPGSRSPPAQTHPDAG